MQLNQTQFYTLVYVLLLALCGAGEYLHFVTPGTFSGMLFVVAGHAAGVFTPSPVSGNSKTS
jgi:hypothetical protein